MRKLIRSNCPVATTVDALQGKWKPLILFALKQGPQRFGVLLRAIEGTTHKVLAEQLRQLAREGIIERRVVQNTPLMKVEYSLTSHGDALRPILNLMCDWGSAHQKRHFRAVSKAS